MSANPADEALEEHVARAIAALKCDNVMEEDQQGCIASGHCHCLDYARAAIAAVREYEGARPHEWIDPGLTTTLERCAAESERAACEAIARDEAKVWAKYGHGNPCTRIADALAARNGKGDGK